MDGAQRTELVTSGTLEISSGERRAALLSRHIGNSPPRYSIKESEAPVPDKSCPGG